MEISRTTIRAIALAAVAAAGCESSRANVPPEMRVRVLVYEAVALESGVLDQAEAEASRIFRAAGIEMIWVNRAAITGSDLDHRILTLKVRLLIPEPAFRPKALGFAVPASEGAVYAAVFYDRVVKTCERFRLSHAQLTGLAMAHELGHLLLGNVEHTRSGLMAARWSAADLKLAQLGLLLFTHGQAAVMQKEVLRQCPADNRTR